MKILLNPVFWIFLFFSNTLFSQSTGDYRNIGNVTFSSSTNWERYNGSAWVSAGSAPSNSDGIIDIETGTASITSSVTLDQVIVRSGAILEINNASATMTIANGSGVDLDIYGTFEFKNSKDDTGIVFNSGSTVTIETDGVVNISSTSNGGTSRYTFATNSQVTWMDAAIYYWNGTSPYITSNVVYFPTNSGSPIFKDKGGGVPVGAGSSNTTTINGRYHLETTKTWQNSAIKYFRDGIILDNNATLTLANTCGQIQISGSSAQINAGTGASIVLNNTNGLAITGQATLNTNLTVTTGTLNVPSGGILNLGTNIISGSGTFSVASGGHIRVGSVAGISSMGSTGNIQTTTRTFNNGGYYEYYGTNKQSTGTGFPSASSGKLIINNNQHVSLTNTASILTSSGSLEFLDGCLLLDERLLEVQGSITGYDENKFVCTCAADGSTPASTQGLKLSAPISFFPVGSTVNSLDYAPVIIDNQGTQDKFLVRVTNSVLENGENGNEILGEVVDHTWFITEDVGGGSDATITLQWQGMRELGGFDRTNCHMSRHNGSEWDAGPDDIASGTDPYTFSRSNIMEFSPFAIGSGLALPVELLSFSAEKHQNSTSLHWQTASEINAKSFEIQRAANPSDAFENISSVPAEGRAAIYKAIDNHPLPGDNYYRLQMVDYDGTFAYSPIVSVRFETNKPVKVFPSPVMGQLTIAFDEPQELPVTWIITDAVGRQILQGTWNFTGTTEIVEVENLLPGHYWIRIIRENKVETLDFVKQ